MGCEQGEIWITYNGEVYNYLELREELQQLGWCFQSMTDTEVILRAYQQWGIECLSRFNGMFAFAIWDGLRNRLFCARDRLGIKPFYFRETSDGIMFGSEIKALLQDPDQVRSSNRKAVHAFLVLGPHAFRVSAADHHRFLLEGNAGERFRLGRVAAFDVELGP